MTMMAARSSCTSAGRQGTTPPGWSTWQCQIVMSNMFMDNKHEPPPMQNITDWGHCCHECTDGGQGHPNEGSCDNACYNKNTKECWLRKYSGGMLTMAPGMVCGPNRKPVRSDCTCTFEPELPGKHFTALVGAIVEPVVANTTAQCQQFCCDRADYNDTSSCAFFSFDNHSALNQNRRWNRPCLLFASLNKTTVLHDRGMMSGRVSSARCPSNITLPGTEHRVMPYNPYVSALTIDAARRWWHVFEKLHAARFSAVTVQMRHGGSDRARPGRPVCADGRALQGCAGSLLDARLRRSLHWLHVCLRCRNRGLCRDRPARCWMQLFGGAGTAYHC